MCENNCVSDGQQSKGKITYFVELKDYQVVNEQHKVRKVFNLKQYEEDEDEEDDPVYKMNMGDQPGDKEYFVELKDYQAVSEQLKVRKVLNLKQDECNKSFSSKQMLRYHIKGIHEKVKDFDCEQCSYSTNQKCNLARHITNHERKGLKGSSHH